MIRISNFIYQITGFNKNNHNSFKNPVFLLLGILLLGVIFLAYSNHFDNSFQFDDAHTIQNNAAIRELNIKDFFADGSTFSSLPTNQSYRPYITTINALDYQLGSGSTKPFHIHIFISFVLTCLLLCVLVKKILDKIHFSVHNQFWGLTVAAVFGLLCANAETVNYVIQRAEIEAGLYILAGFVAFLQGGIWRSKYLYLIFPFIGFFAKEMAFVFSPLLFLYVLIFEENTNLLYFYKKEEFKKCVVAFKKVFPSVALTALFLVFYIRMLPDTFQPGGISTYQYLITQPLVICHYILTFFIPYALSADTDWRAFESITDYRAITGIILLLVIIYLALKTSKNKNTRLISFGLLWFLISLLPTSSFIPFAEVLNDHRPFIPYLGLTIAVVFGIKYVLTKFLKEKATQPLAQNTIFIVVLLFLGLNAYGVFQRNKVWKTELSLWKDVTLKSPQNGRGFMNYGLALMAQGDYQNAEINYIKALELTPNYPTLYTNLGILKNAMGNKAEAEEFFKKSISLPTSNQISYYYYASFLSNNNRDTEAIEFLEKALDLYSGHLDSQLLLFNILHKQQNWEQLTSVTKNILETDPTNTNAKKYLEITQSRKSVLELTEEEALSNPTPEKLLNLSLLFFQAKDYNKCIETAHKAIELKNDYPEAYNNIGIAYVNLNEIDKGIEAYNKALELKPDYELSKNNLAHALTLKQRGAEKILTANDYINISLHLYNSGKYRECIEAAKKSIEIQPTANAYNNICTAYNQLKEYDKAIEACNKALELDANHSLAKGNLAFAISQKNR